MPRYIVEWTTQSDAASPLEAAKDALDAIKNYDSVVFYVYHEQTGDQTIVDLSQDSGQEIVRDNRDDD